MQNNKTSFIKMNAAGNDFVIFDARKMALNLSAQQIEKISNRQNIGCDQLIILKNSADNFADCEIEIYNSDGSKSGACGNATRCVAHLLMEEKNVEEVKIQTAAGVLKCWKNGNLISVDMGIPKFLATEIPLSNSQKNSQKVEISNFSFACVNVGNPHAVTFINKALDDKVFFEVGAKVEAHEFFPQKTNVEFAEILSDNLIAVRVFERGVGETLACGSGACAVAVAAVKNGRVKSNKITTRFKGGDLLIEWNGENSSVIMTGGFQKIFSGEIDEKFLR